MGEAVVVMVVNVAFLEVASDMELEMPIARV